MTGSGAILAFSDMERPEIYSSSRVSEVSSSTAASAMSRPSKQRLVSSEMRTFNKISVDCRSNKNKPRRKPRKRSDIFPTSSSSGSKRGNVSTYDPIMEVSLLMDDEDEDENDLTNLPVIEKHRSSDEDKPDTADDEDNSDDEESEMRDVDHNETLASNLLNRETCV